MRDGIDTMVGGGRVGGSGHGHWTTSINQPTKIDTT